MRRQVHVILAFLVWVDLTLTCQGHDVGRHHTGVHIAMFGDHDEDHYADMGDVEQPGQPAHAEEIGHTSMNGAREIVEAASSTAPSKDNGLFPAKGCMIGPSTGTPEGGDIGTIGAGDKKILAIQIPQFNLHAVTCEVPLLAQAFALPEEPPPRNLV